jgi:pyruvate ferredoxin oxidoreductase beta subunit
MLQEKPRAEMFAPGHRACAGCGVAVAVRLILKGTGPDVIIVTPTGCLETFTSPYGETPWTVPWIHPLFENGAAVASGVEAALRASGRQDEAKVVVIGGDGATFDIGVGALSGMLERGHDVTYICYDNAAYMNTGVQRSGATPYRATTTTTPYGKNSLGKLQRKKDMPAIAMAHGAEYVATASIAYPKDLIKKVAKAVAMPGPKYLQIDCPCNIGWGFDPAKTIEVARLAVQTGLFPVWEAEKGGEIVSRKVKNRKPVEEFMKLQNRFKHLFKDPAGPAEIAVIQSIADANAKKYGLE